MKKRLDHRLLELGLAPDIIQARALIMAGAVLVDDRPLDKAGTPVATDASIRLRDKKRKTNSPWVSRGGEKLTRAIDHWRIDVNGRTCLDVGASTGGFTDVLLQHGAARVYAVDVGYGQLAWKLARDPRVVALDRCNIRTLPRERIAEPADFLTMDLSFISLVQALPPALPFLGDGAAGVLLVKPQFELPREEVETGGVVRDADAHQRAIAAVERLMTNLELKPRGVIPSPITGAKGNREFLFYFDRP